MIWPIVWIWIYNPTDTIHFNRIAQNTYGLRNDIGDVNATNNWWGTNNPSNPHDVWIVSGNVKYNPWLVLSVNWWVKLKNNTILKIGIVGALVSVVLISGCTSYSINETKTFSDGDMSFNYPADFYNVTYSGNEIDSSTMGLIGMLENKDGLTIYVCKNKTGTSLAETKEGTVSSVKTSSTGKILSTSTETNPNGVVVEKMSYTEGGFLIFKGRRDSMYFQSNGDVYAITVYGLDLDKKKLSNIDNIIFQSIK